MADESNSPPPPERPRRERRGRRRTALLATAWTVAALVLLGGLGVGYLYVKFNGNLSSVDIDAALGRDRPDDVHNGSMDILVLGSDSRAGANSSYGSDSGARSDTAMIIHLYRGHRRATVLSIPRDTLVERPDCTRDGHRAPGAADAMFNSAYEVGGPACAVKTVESMSGIRMDHFIEVDFTGFKKLVNALGGVPVHTSRPIRDKDSHLDLPAGEHTLDGEQSLGLVRTRHAVADGSDLGRIHLQQAFVKSLIKQVKSVDLFDSPSRLYRVADTATKAITTDSDLASVNDLKNLAGNLKKVDSDDMRMVTLPVKYDPGDPNRVVPRSDDSRRVWRALRADRQIPASAVRESAGDEDAGRDVVG